MSWFQRLKVGLTKAKDTFTSTLNTILSSQKLDEDALEKIHELLISHDVGIKMADKIIEDLKQKKFQQSENLDFEVKNYLCEIIVSILSPVSIPLNLNHLNKPHIIILVGINGNGKTTTAGKLALKFSSLGKKVMMAACDTFRAAAVEQLVEWSKRAECQITVGQDKQDPSSVAFKALMEAKKLEHDFVIIDTAGRLHNNQNLMTELAKLLKVLKKIDSNLSVDTIMVLDATTGQNAISQVDAFKKIIDITGLIVTKLDGTSKCGILLALTSKYSLPIHAIGIGESIEDLDTLDPRSFAKSIIGID